LGQKGIGNPLMRQVTITIRSKSQNQTVEIERLKDLCGDTFLWMPFRIGDVYDIVLLWDEMSSDELNRLSTIAKKILWLDNYTSYEESLPDNVELFPGQVKLPLIVQKIVSLANDLNDHTSLAIKTTTNAIIVFNAQGEPLWANQGFEKIYGYSFEEFTKRYKSFYEASVLENPAEIIEQLKQNQQVEYTSHVNHQQNGKVWLKTSITPFFDQQNRLDRFVVVETNISELKQIEQSLEEGKKEIEKQKQLFEIEKQRSDDLLHNILPKEVALKGSIPKSV